MKQRRLRIGVDLDGVVYDLVREMLPLLSDLAGRPVVKEAIVEFDIPRALNIPISNAELFQQVAESDLYWRASHPSVMAKEGIQQITDAGHTVTIVTSRPRIVKSHHGDQIDLARQTEDWVRCHLPADVEVEIRGEDFEHPTEKVTRRDRFHLFIDDEPRSLHRIQRLRSLYRVETRPVAFDQPWNQSWAGDRVHDWHELTEFVRLHAEGMLDKLGGLVGRRREQA